jgi:hypothetical protein
MWRHSCRKVHSSPCDNYDYIASNHGLIQDWGILEVMNESLTAREDRWRNGFNVIAPFHYHILFIHIAACWCFGLTCPL